MKYILIIICFLFTVNSFGQDFRIEYKFFLLQNFIKENKIKSIKIHEAEDSISVISKVKYHCFFDEKGRLTKVLDYYFANDSIPERAIVYGYEADESYFRTKSYQYINASGRVLYAKHWDIEWRANFVSERLRNIDGEVYRENTLEFNYKGQLVQRVTKSGVITYTVDFSYDRENRLSGIDLEMDNPTLKTQPKGNSISTLIQYNFNEKLISSIQWNKDKTAQFNTFYYDYNGFEITRKIGWAKRKKDGKTIKSIERIDFRYAKNGLLVFAHKFNDTGSKIPDRYHSFHYQFYDSPIITSHANEAFVSAYFTSIFKIE